MAARLLSKTFFVVLLSVFIAQHVFADDSSQEVGREVYLSYGCAVCHGKNGDGKGMSSQKFNPPPADLRDPKAYRFGNSKGNIRMTIINGIKEENSIMPAFKDMDEKDLKALIDFLISLQSKEKQ